MAAPAFPILCVAGTGPGVGKTLLAAGLVRRAVALGGRPVGMKPIEVGCRYGEDHDLVSSDGDALRAARGEALPPLVAAPYRLTPIQNPLLAARASGLDLSLEALEQAVQNAKDFGDVLIVELPSGALAPIAEDGNGLDLAVRLASRVLIVATPAPGVESRVLGLVESARARKLTVGGIQLNSPPPEPAAAEDLCALMSERAGVPVFQPIPCLEGEVQAAVDEHLESEKVLERSFRT